MHAWMWVIIVLAMKLCWYLDYHNPSLTDIQGTHEALLWCRCTERHCMSCNIITASCSQGVITECHTKLYLARFKNKYVMAFHNELFRCVFQIKFYCDCWLRNNCDYLLQTQWQNSYKYLHSVALIPVLHIANLKASSIVACRIQCI